MASGAAARMRSGSGAGCARSDHGQYARANLASARAHTVSVGRTSRPARRSARRGSVEAVRLGVGLEGPWQPEGTAQIAGPGRRARLGQPLAVDLERAVRVHEDVAVTLAGRRPGDGHLLMPAVLAADGVRLDGERQVLMNAGILPPHALGVGILAGPRAHAVHLPHAPAAGPFPLEI